MSEVKLTITKSSCRSGYHKKGDTFFVTDICPALCHELWHTIYPNVYTMINGGMLDYGNERSKCFDSICPDGGRVHIHGEVVEEE